MCKVEKTGIIIGMMETCARLFAVSFFSGSRKKVSLTSNVYTDLFIVARMIINQSINRPPISSIIILIIDNNAHLSIYIKNLYTYILQFIKPHRYIRSLTPYDAYKTNQFRSSPALQCFITFNVRRFRRLARIR